MWRSVGFLMNFAAVIELATLVAFAVILLGGRDKREGGWKIVSSLLAGIALVQLASMAVVVRVWIDCVFGPLTDFAIGLFVRPRQSLLCRLETRPQLDLVHRLLVYSAFRCCRHNGCCQPHAA